MKKIKKELRRIEKQTVRETARFLHKHVPVEAPPVPAIPTPSVPVFEPQPVPDLMPEPVPELKTEPVPELQTELVSAMKTEPVAEMKKESLSEMKKEPDSEMDKEADPEMKKEPDSEMDKEPDPEMKKEPDSEIDKEPESEMNKEPDSAIGKEPQYSVPTLADDLISLYKEETLYDVKLRTESEIFPAHKTVLCARSPVFKKMFTNDMRERASNCVDIPDIKADTLRRLLLFLYTDTVADMDLQRALDLYFAADKYQIDSLKFKCSTFLKSNVQPNNCCDILLLSDIHQDVDLKQFVQEYMITNDINVFGTDEWKAFMGNHVQLAAETMYLRYAKK